MTTEPAAPETFYADSGGLSIACQVSGSGAPDLVVVPDEWPLWQARAD